LQSTYIQRRIANHQGSSPTNIFSTATQLAKGAKAFAYLVTLLKEENETLRKANEALLKRRRAKHTRLQDSGSLNLQEAQVLIATKEGKALKRQKMLEEGGEAEARPAT